MAGGRDKDKYYLSSTEIYSTVQLKWNYGVQLPSARGYFSGISLNNNVFLLGKQDQKSNNCDNIVLITFLLLNLIWDGVKNIC